MNLFRITLLTFLLSQLAWAQSPNATPSAMGTPGGGGNGAGNTPQVAPVTTGKFCPFNVTLDGYIDNTNLQAINQLATNLKSSNTDNPAMCQMVGTNIGALLQMIEPDKFLPPTPTPTPGAGSQTPKPPETCVTNPQRCADLLTTLMNAYKEGKCSGSADGIANALVSLAVKIGGVAGPEGAVVAISAQVLMEVYNIAKERSGAIGSANKLTKDSMEQMRNNIKGLMACMANDTYYGTVCRPVMYNKIAGLISNPMKGNPSPTDKMRIADPELQSVYSCIMSGKTLKDCMKEIKTVEGKAATEDDFVHDRKLLALTSKSAELITDGQLATFIKTAQSYNEKELNDLGKKYNDLTRRKKDYNTNSYGGHHLNLIRHCFYNYVPEHTDEKDVHYFTNSSHQFDHLYCGRLNSCLKKLNEKDPSLSLTTFDNFTGGKKLATDETACLGIMKLNQLDETYMQDQLNAIKFTPTLTTGCTIPEGFAGGNSPAKETTNN